MDDAEIWLSEDLSEEEEELESSSDPTIFNLPLTPLQGQSGGFHVRNRNGERQRPTVSDFRVGSRKKPAYTVSCCAKAMIHGKMGEGSLKRATLLVYELKFHCRRGTRIKDASIGFEFQAGFGSDGLAGPSVIAIRPDRELRMEPTTQNEDSKRTMALTVGPNIPGVDAGLTVSNEQSVSKSTKDYTVVSGEILRDDFGNQQGAHFMLAANESQKSNIPTALTIVLLLERENDSEFVLTPYIKVTPNFTTWAATLASSRPVDEPVYFDAGIAPFNQLGGTVTDTVEIDPENLGATDLDRLFDCELYTEYAKAVKAFDV